MKKGMAKELALSGAAAGVIYGVIVFAVYVLIGRFFFGDYKDISLILLIVEAVIIGAVAGAIVGLITVKTRGMVGGIVTGGLFFAVIKVLMCTLGFGLSGTLTAVGAVISLIFGAVFGYIVAQGVMNSIKWDELE